MSMSSTLPTGATTPPATARTAHASVRPYSTSSPPAMPHGLRPSMLTVPAPEAQRDLPLPLARGAAPRAPATARRRAQTGQPPILTPRGTIPEVPHPTGPFDPAGPRLLSPGSPWRTDGHQEALQESAQAARPVRRVLAERVRAGRALRGREREGAGDRHQRAGDGRRRRGRAELGHRGPRRARLRRRWIACEKIAGAELAPARGAPTKNGRRSRASRPKRNAWRPR